jgi:hypothetical protein
MYNLSRGSRKRKMNDQRAQIKSKISEANNILVTVSRNPSVDELTAALGLTLAIDKMRKHSSAIFSGEIPDFVKFLRPEKTFESSADSFRDFIISLDKEKADKLRYKVEGDLVKIFITPYHTQLSPDDLVFSEGEFNVELVIALGVKRQEDLDKAIVGHGRILHDAAIATINLDGTSSLGAIHWSDIEASGYSEVVAGLISEIDEKLFSKQISTALLTGIVLATEQFSNANTKPATMAMASKLLASGADQQLIVAEIRGGGAVAVAAPNMTHDIPEKTQTLATTTDVTAELEALPSVEDQQAELESIKSSLDPYMPPPLPDFSTDQMPSPEELSATSNYDSIPPAIFPEGQATDIIDLEPAVEPSPKPVTVPAPTSKPEPITPTQPDPSQFIIPV